MALMFNTFKGRNTEINALGFGTGGGSGRFLTLTTPLFEPRKQIIRSMCKPLKLFNVIFLICNYKNITFFCFQSNNKLTCSEQN